MGPAAVSTLLAFLAGVATTGVVIFLAVAGVVLTFVWKMERKNRRYRRRRRK